MGERLKRLKSPIYEALFECPRASYIESFSRFSRFLGFCKALTCSFSCPGREATQARSVAGQRFGR